MASGSQKVTTYSSNTLIPKKDNASLSNFKDDQNLIYTYYGGSNSISDKPTSVDAFGVMSFKTAEGWYGQLLMSSNTATGLYWRTATSLSGGWHKLLDSSNYTDYAYALNGSNTGTKLRISTQSAAYTNGIQFMNGTTKKGSIGTDNTGIIGIYGTKVVLRPQLDASTQGIEVTTEAMYPTASMALGTASKKWSTVYATTFDGNAATATKLATARTIRTNLASTATASFDGSANITPGVTGVLPIANGGTGVTTEALIRATYGIEYIAGTQTANTNAWTGVTSSAALYTGKTIAYYLPYAGTSTAATLNLTLSGGSTTGAKNVRINNSNVTTHFPAGTVILLVYDGTYWKVDNYDSNSNTLLRVYSSSTNLNVPLIGQSSANNVNAAWTSYTGTYKDWYGAIPNNDALRAKINLSTGHITVPGGITANIIGNVTGSSGSCTGNAATATALTSNAGGATQPIYFSNGKPVATSYSLAASVGSGTKNFLSRYTDAHNIGSSTICNIANINYSTITPDYTGGGEQYHKAWLAYICNNYSTANIYIGTANPNARGPILGNIYSVDEKDSTTGLPRYSTFLFNNLGGTLEVFGTQSYNYYHYTYLNNSNYTTYTVKKDGTGASGTWGISITGNAATAIKATQDGSGNTIDSTYLKLSGGTLTGQLIINQNSDVGLDSGSGSLVIGSTSGASIGIDDNEIMARNNNTAATLYLQSEGGYIFTQANTTINNANLTVGGTINDYKLYAGEGINADDVRTTNGIWICNSVLTNTPTDNHGALFGMGSVGTPCQYWLPDASYDIYKRYWDNSVGWTSWTKINNAGQYLPCYITTSCDANNCSQGLYIVHAGITNAPIDHHGALLYISSVGTPFQLYFPDNLPVVYKRWYSSGSWNGWQILNAAWA